MVSGTMAIWRVLVSGQLPVSSPMTVIAREASPDSTMERTKVRLWLHGLVLVLALFVIAVVVSAIFIANDPANAAGGINGFLYALDDGVKAVLRAPIDFFGSLLTFVECLGS
ncbi:hypothetical protein MOQ72_39070 [Saccharopolyspora sp. K220]|uniref:hypothetical protein n=1 Tax=Saccharopolyspora soli TaxID=2926618 RepID=UPI001F5AA804|nr:hypothetical protein [Saccharopolyspora soli]MCI2423432.1 hypothetical protein [Saccharopolyspora soli]